MREAFSNPDAAHKMLARTGMAFISDADEDYDGDGHDGMGSFADEEDNVSSDDIHAALEKSQKDSSHGPLNLKTENPKRRYFKKKKA